MNVKHELKDRGTVNPCCLDDYAIMATHGLLDSRHQYTCDCGTVFRRTRDSTKEHVVWERA